MDYLNPGPAPHITINRETEKTFVCFVKTGRITEREFAKSNKKRSQQTTYSCLNHPSVRVSPPVGSVLDAASPDIDLLSFEPELGPSAREARERETHGISGF